MSFGQGKSRMLRWAGYILLIISSGAFGIKLEKAMRQRAALTEELSVFAKYAGDCIENLMYPLDRIFSTFRSDGELGRAGFDKALAENGCVCAAGKISDMLSAAGKETFEKFAYELGEGDAQSQIKLCRHTSALLAEESDRLKKDIQAKGRAIRFIPPLAACLVILILI